MAAAGQSSNRNAARQRQTFYLDTNRKLAFDGMGSKALSGASARPETPKSNYKATWSDAPEIPTVKPKPGLAQPKVRPQNTMSGFSSQKPSATRQLFRNLDVNRDGMISYAEFNKGIAKQSFLEKLSQMGQSFDLTGGRSAPIDYGKHDPLNLKEQPQTMDRRPPAGDETYGTAELSPDSLATDVEALLAQERLLVEQANFWNDRARQALDARRNLRSEMEAQEVAARDELAEIRRQITTCRDEVNFCDNRVADLTRETRECLTEANSMLAEATAVRQAFVDSGRPIPDVGKSARQGRSTGALALTSNSTGSPTRGADFKSFSREFSRGSPPMHANTANSQALMDSLAEEEFENDEDDIASLLGSPTSRPTGSPTRLPFDFGEDDDIDLDTLRFS